MLPNIFDGQMIKWRNAKMTFRKFQVVIDVTVINPERVMEQATAKVIDAQCTEILEEMTLRDAVGWLFDSGSSVFDYALEIEGSTTEEVRDVS